MARFTNYGSRRKEPSERAPRADRERDRLRGSRPVHEGHAAVRDVRELDACAGSAPPRRRARDRRRRPARPADPPGALGRLKLADDPAGLRPRRAARRRRHRRGASAEWRAGADADGKARLRLSRRGCRAGSRRLLTATELTARWAGPRTRNTRIEAW